MEDIRRRWSPWAWLGLTLAAAAEAAVVVVVVWLTFFGFSSTCNDQPDPGEVWQGRGALLLTFAAAAAPWALAALLDRRAWARYAVFGALASSPALLGLLAGLSDDAWVGSFCF